MNTLSIDNSRLQLTLYPNPASSEIYFKNLMLENENAEVQISDLSGRLVKRQVLSPLGFPGVNINDLNNGIYIVTVTINNERVLVEKLSVINKA